VSTSKLPPHGSAASACDLSVLLAPGAIIASVMATFVVRSDLDGILADGFVYPLPADALRGVAAPAPD
jgi:hypothetical protein